MNAQMNANVNRSKKKYKILVIEDNDQRMKKICDICGASFETKSPTRIIVMTVVQIQQEIYI